MPLLQEIRSRNTSLLHLLLLGACIPVLFISACKKDSGTLYRADELENPAVNGYTVTDNYGIKLGDVGKPNIRNGEVLNDLAASAHFINVFPNPAHKFCTIAAKVPSTSSYHVWIVQAQASAQFAQSINYKIGRA